MKDKLSSEEQEITKPSLQDYISLTLTFLSKLNRAQLKNNSDKSAEHKEFYETFFLRKDLADWEQDKRKIIRRNTIRNFLDQHTKHPGCILDVGCGFGEVLWGIPEPWRRYGLDYSLHNVKSAQSILKEKATIIHGTVYEIPFANSIMDVCCCLEVLEHIKDDLRALKEIYRILKPAGLIILSVPHTYYWPYYKTLIGHYRHYTRHSLESLLTRSGFTIIDYLPNYPNWHIRYSRSYVITRILCLTLGRVLNQRDVYRFTWPWAKETHMTSIWRKLLSQFNADKQLNYSLAYFGTFIAARKTYR